MHKVGKVYIVLAVFICLYIILIVLSVANYNDDKAEFEKRCKDSGGVVLIMDTGKLICVDTKTVIPIEMSTEW